MFRLSCVFFWLPCGIDFASILIDPENVFEIKLGSKIDQKTDEKMIDIGMYLERKSDRF